MLNAPKRLGAEWFAANCFANTLYYTPHHLTTRFSDRRAAPGPVSLLMTHTFYAESYAYMWYICRNLGIYVTYSQKVTLICDILYMWVCHIYVSNMGHMYVTCMLHIYICAIYVPYMAHIWFFSRAGKLEKKRSYYQENHFEFFVVFQFFHSFFEKEIKMWRRLLSPFINFKKQQILKIYSYFCVGTLNFENN